MEKMNSITEKLRHLFGQWGMPWRRVILLAVISAVYTALINQVPALQGTSFTDIAVWPDAWLFFGILVSVNCEKWWEAALKSFVFFLVSQPLIYLIEMPFSAEGAGLFRYYNYWFKITLLMIPAGAAAFFLKKRNLLSAAMVFLADLFLFWSAWRYLKSTAACFPNHLLSVIYDIVFAFLLIPLFCDGRKVRRAVFAMSLAALIVFLAFDVKWYLNRTLELDLGPGEWSYETDGTEGVSEITIKDGHTAVIVPKGEGYLCVVFTDENGTEAEYELTVSGGAVFSTLID